MKVRARILATIAVTAALAPAFLLHAQQVVPAQLTEISLHEYVTSPWETPELPPAPAPQSAPRTQYSTPKVELFLGYSRFGVGFNSNTGTIGNRMVGLNGGSASLAFNFNRFIALVADVGGYDDSQLQLSGTGANQPMTVNASGTAFTYLFGPRFTLGKQRRVSVFAQVLAGGVHASAVTVTNCSGSACTPLPSQNALAITGGGGVDIRLTHHIALRPIQAEYMLTRFAAVPSGSSASQNDLRLSAGLVFRFAGRPMSAPQPSAAMQPPPPPPPIVSAPPPPPPPTPPTITCSASPQSILSGASATITSHAFSAHYGTLVYSYTASSGSITGNNETALLTAVGSNPGNISVTCNVSDDMGLTASASTSVNVTSPAPVAAPQRKDLCTISFERDRRRPVRVDNEAKACLDEIALTMQRDAGGRLVIIGSHSSNETPKAGSERASNEKLYLTSEKDIDPQRIELRVGKAGTRTVANVFLPEGATF